MKFQHATKISGNYIIHQMCVLSEYGCCIFCKMLFLKILAFVFEDFVQFVVQYDELIIDFGNAYLINQK